ncbi:MAG: hypothetical protein J6S21_06920, partial [Victivallales bacterium]|nr:hypothetical protein [Victivallales bacterium]
MTTLLKNIILPALLCTALLGFTSGCGGESTSASVEFFTVQRGDLRINITASGSVETARSVNINQLIGRTAKIVTIVPEGTIITDEDVKNRKVLVQFDSKDLEDQLYERQTAYENASASAVTAEETLEIQRSDNESSIRKAELDVLYAESDLRKLVGEKLADSFHDKCPEDINA